MQTTSHHSRRALLTAALGAGAATVAGAIVRPNPAAAASGDFDSSDSATPAVTASNTVTTGNAYAVRAETASSGLNASGVFGLASATTGAPAGLWGEAHSPQGSGVYGACFSVDGDARGVWGDTYGSTGTGVYGATNTSSGACVGVRGYSASSEGTGVIGQATAGSGSTVGVYGEVSSNHGYGVQGLGPNAGVFGKASAATGPTRAVIGHALSHGGTGVVGVVCTVLPAVQRNTGVHGYSDTGTGVFASTDAPNIGVALHAVGRVKFDNSVGIATIAKGRRSVVVTPGIDLGARSAAVATLQGNAGSAQVQFVSVNASANTLTIFLSANTTLAVKVAWHVFG